MKIWTFSRTAVRETQKNIPSASKATKVLKLDDQDEFFLEFDNGKTHRISVKDGDLTFTLINGTDCKITTSNGYPAVKITQKL